MYMSHRIRQILKNSKSEQGTFVTLDQINLQHMYG